MSSDSAPLSSSPHHWPTALALGFALLVSVVAGARLMQFYNALPVQQLRRTTSDEWNRAMRSMLEHAPQPIRDAWDMQGASSRMLGLRFGNSPRTPETDLSEIREMLSSVTSSHLPRVQYTTAVLLVLERREASVEDRWSAVRAYLEGLETGDFSHYTEDLIAALAQHFQAIGLDAGTAAAAAWFDFSFVHGPFLEFAVPRLEQLAVERDAAGDQAGARLCRRVVRRLLRQWVLLPGPAGLRMLAADFLADDLEREDPAHAVARDLREWRAVYRARAATRPHTLLGATGGPSLAPGTQTAFAKSTVLATWSACAALAAAIVTLLTCWSLFTRPPGGGGARLILLGIVAAALIVVGGYTWAGSQTSAVAHDLRVDYSRAAYWPMHPFIAAAATVIVMILCSRLVSHGSRLRGMTKLTLAVWIVLASGTFGLTLRADAARREHNSTLEFVLHDDYAAIAGSEADRSLDSLRAWKP